MNLGTFLYFIYTHFILFCPILYYPIGVKLVQNFENWCKPLLRPSLCFFVSIFKTQTTRHFCVLNMPINKNQIINSNLEMFGYTFLGATNAVSQTAFSKDISQYDELIITLTTNKTLFSSSTIPLNWSRIGVLQTTVLDIRGKYSDAEYQGIITVDVANEKTTSFYVSNNSVMLEVYGKKFTK